MATTNNVNRITLKISTVFDKTGTLKEAQKLQNALDKQSEVTNKKREKGINTVTNAQNKNNNAIKNGSKATKSLGQNFADAFKKAVKGFVVLQLLLAITTQIRRAVELAFLLDKAFTNFAIVSKATASEIAQVDAEVGNLTKRLGALKAEVVNTVTEFSRAGFTIQESMQLAETAIIGANVGMTSLENVTTFLVAGLKAFRLEAEESTRILDVLFRVANTTAIDLEGISEAFLRSANTLNTAGASLEQSAGLIAAANESIQNPAKVGSALNTIASRLRGVGVDGEAIPKLAKDFKAVGIEIQNVDGSFKNVFDVFEEFANIYDDLDEITRESLLEKLAGKRQKNVLIGLLTNFETAKQAVIDAENSAGESAEAQEKFLKSLEGQAKLLKDAWNSLLETLRDSGALEVVIKFLTGFANVLTFIVQKIPFVISGIAGLTTAFIVMSTKITGAIALMSGGLSVVIGGLALVAQGFAIWGNKLEKATQELAEHNAEIEILKDKISKLEQIEAVDNLTKSEENLLGVLRDQLETRERLAELAFIEKLEEEQDALDKLVKKNERFVKSLLDNGLETNFLAGQADEALRYNEALKRLNDEGFSDYETSLLSSKETAATAMAETKEGTTAFELASKVYEDASSKLRDLDEAYELFGIRIRTVAEETEEKAVPAISELEQALRDAKDQVGVANDDFRLLVDSFLDLEESGYLSAEALDALLIAYPDLIKATDLTIDGIKRYIKTQEDLKISTLETTKTSLEKQLEASKTFIEMTKNRIEAIKAEQEARTGLAGIIARIAGGTAIKALDIAIGNQEKNATDALNQIVRIENEIAGLRAKTNDALNSPDSGDDGGSSKQVEVLTDLERALNEVNFQIEIQQKLLSRTEIPNEQIKINEKLIELYQKQKNVLIEQQRELESQRSVVVKGTEAYDDFIDKSYDLSLAIEDSTNNIYSLEQANRELNKTIEETELGKLEDGLESIADSIQNEITKEIARIKDLAKLRAESLKNDIEDEKIKLQALKDANSEKEEQIKLEQLLLNLQDLRERRQNILNNKNVRIVRDADIGFENIADPREVRAINEEIIDAEKAIADFRREQVFNEEVKKLELTIEGLEKQAKAEQESYDDRVELLEGFQKDIDEQIELGGEVSETLVGEIMDELEGIEQGSYTARLGNLETFIGEYNSKIDELSTKRADLQDIQDKIKTAQENIQGLQTAPSINQSPQAGSITGSTPSTSSLGNNISSNNTNTTNSSTSIGSINVNTNANTLDGLIKDARRQTPLLSKN